ncbi:LysM domain-containing protein (fragment) [Candidatus Desulfosporosinus infrequens]|uniref:LysM domain-containing protein n=1 Tax=Candidatus Desulfosporosinus infrequens TaxID=2043169 RepID=A0A2U3KBF2_9FIRM
MYYIIRRGDSLHSIAVHYGTTVSNLMALNPQISNPHKIHVGERILISSKSKKWGSNESSQHRGR